MARGWGGNMNNYAIINGIRVELTDEQVKTLGFKRNNPFERVEKYTECYCINASNIVESSLDTRDVIDNNRYKSCNYFNDKDFANQVALRQLLYRKLLKFAYDNNCEDDKPWDCESKHYRVYYSHAHKIFKTEVNFEGQHPGAYFSSEEAAKRAIKEVIEPFLKEHPDFVW